MNTALLKAAARYAARQNGSGEKGNRRIFSILRLHAYPSEEDVFVQHDARANQTPLPPSTIPRTPKPIRETPLPTVPGTPYPDIPMTPRSQARAREINELTLQEVRCWESVNRVQVRSILGWRRTRVALPDLKQQGEVVVGKALVGCLGLLVFLLVFMVCLTYLASL